MSDDSENSEIEEFKNLIEAYKRAQKRNETRILITLLLLLIFAIMLACRSFNDKTTITLGQRDINTDYVAETPVNDETQEHINKEFIVTNSNQQFTENLGIFDNENYDNKPIIYPGIKSTYYFNLTNKQDFDLRCDIEFSEVNKGNIPIKYKLKENGKYIKGSQDKYVNCTELSTKDISLSANSQNIYELEWEWVNDTTSTNSYGDKEITYGIGITINAK